MKQVVDYLYFVGVAINIVATRVFVIVWRVSTVGDTTDVVIIVMFLPRSVVIVYIVIIRCMMVRY